MNRIERFALRHPATGHCYSVPFGKIFRSRHELIGWLYDGGAGERIVEYEHGFIDSNNVFHDRRSAFPIALAAGQVDVEKYRARCADTKNADLSGCLYEVFLLPFCQK